MSDTPETDKFRITLDGMREINQRDRLLIHARRLERERDDARERVKELTYENENLYRRLESVHEVYRLSSVCRKLMIENQKLKGEQP